MTVCLEIVPELWDRTPKRAILSANKHPVQISYIDCSARKPMRARVDRIAEEFASPDLDTLSVIICAFLIDQRVFH
jgi:hypothetical protein